MVNIVKKAKLILSTVAALIIAQLCSMLTMLFFLQTQYVMASAAALISFVMLTLTVVINNKDQFLMTDE